MSQVVSTRLPDHTAERLKRLARRLGKTPSETGAILIEESLRESEFPYIEFRHSPLGRQPYLKNSSLALWEVIQIAQSYGLVDILAAVKRTAIPKPHDLSFCFFPIRGSAPAAPVLLCSGLMVALQTDTASPAAKIFLLALISRSW